MPKNSCVILSTDETAARLGVDRRTIRRYFLRGEFPHSRKLGTGKTAQLAILESDVVTFQSRKKRLAALNKE